MVRTIFLPDFGFPWGRKTKVIMEVMKNGEMQMVREDS